MEPKTKGQIAYETYVAALGCSLPPWPELKAKEPDRAAAWEAVAAAILKQTCKRCGGEIAKDVCATCGTWA